MILWLWPIFYDLMTYSVFPWIIFFCNFLFRIMDLSKFRDRRIHNSFLGVNLLRGLDMPLGENCYCSFWKGVYSKRKGFTSEKGSTLRGKNSLPLGANWFLLSRSLFRSDCVQENKQEVTKVVSLAKIGEKSTFAYGFNDQLKTGFSP